MLRDGKRVPRDAREICKANIAPAEAKKKQLRVDFPFAVKIVDELSALFDDGHPPFKPKVLWMKENGKEWKR